MKGADLPPCIVMGGCELKTGTAGDKPLGVQVAGQSLSQVTCQFPAFGWKKAPKPKEVGKKGTQHGFQVVVGNPRWHIGDNVSQTKIPLQWSMPFLTVLPGAVFSTLGSAAALFYSMHFPHPPVPLPPADTHYSSRSDHCASKSLIRLFLSRVLCLTQAALLL
ncbi:hypothetical protein UY3_15547 [Chelonia mydas]|uniref:Uncharacterized protein n=1 Tax=Chelonia mydas TaxID=8469 RepID=M7B5I0_CHEMY|nr:hypothetical protein UY3_15547 [Chelonia mydas]